MRLASLCAILAAALVGCGDSTPSTTGSSSPTTPSSAVGAEGSDGPISNPAPVAAAPESTRTTWIELDEEQSLDLVANRHLWHRRGAGLVIPMASEAMRKYAHEYSNPWGKVMGLDGKQGRVMKKRQTTLRFGWFDDEPARRLSLRVHGLVAGQKASIRLDGKTVANINLEARWQDVGVDIKGAGLATGEHELTLHLAKAQRDGAHQSYGLWNAIALSTEAGAATSIPTQLEIAADREAGGTSLKSLAGDTLLSQLVEIPPEAIFDTQLLGAGRFVLRATTVDGKTHELMNAEGTADGWTRKQVKLDALAGKLVRLDLEMPADGAWGAPRIALPAAVSRPKPAPAKNLILLVVDALRSDHVPLYEKVYGEGHAVSMPHTVAEAQKGSVVFLHNQAASPSSPPSHGSIQTGMIPRVHGVDGDRGTPRAGVPTISTQVGAKGISSGYYGNNPFGMGRWKEPGKWTEFHQPGQEGKSNDCSTLVSMMLDFSAAQKAAGKRFFISSLPYETHTPYRYHEGISDKYHSGPWPAPVGKNVNGDLLGALGAGKVSLNQSQWSQLKALYKGEAEYWDGCFDTLVKGLDEAGLGEDTVLVLTSDHGEGMFEHGKMGHAFGHNRELGDVPFVIYWPKLAAGIREIDTVTSHRDIAPTILDILGVPVDEQVQGQSVLPLALREGGAMPRVVALEYGRSYSLRARDYKLIVGYNGEQEVFDLRGDPWETKNLLPKGKHMAIRYLRDMAGFFLEHRSQWRYSSWGTLNHHEQGFLDALK